MGSDKDSPGMTRRVLLTAGGFTLLGLWAADRADHRTAAATAGQEPADHATAASRAAHQAQTGRADTVTARPPGSAARSHAGSHPGSHPGPHPGPYSGRTEPDQADLTVARRGGEQPVFTIADGPRAIALTIDDGPDPVYTPQVLSLLARYRVTATFSMIGIEVQSHRSVAREVAAAGHLIANHTWSHLDLAALSPAAVTEQMSRATGAIHAATGRTPDLFRAPYGAWSPFVLAQCARTGMTPLGWSVDPRDWSRPGVSSIVANILRNTRTGSIILEHDGGGNRSQTIAALKIVIPRVLAAGYYFRTP